MTAAARRSRRLAPRLLGALTVVLLTACGGASPPAAKSGDTEAPYATLVVALETVPVERSLDGRVEAVEQGTIAAQTAGQVTALGFDVNDSVAAGALLVRLRGTEQRAGLAQARASIVEAAARETEAQARYARVADMQARKVVPRAMLDEATANRDAAVARLAAARALESAAAEGVAYTEVRAPYAGIVTRRHVQVGESVAPGSPLLGLSSPGKLRVVVEVPQQWVAAVREGGKASIWIGERRLEAARLTLFPEASGASATVRARIDLPDGAAGAYPGMLVKVGMAVGTDQRLRVPVASVVARSEVTGVYVFDPRGEGRTSFRQLRLGHRADRHVEVLAGLAAGERIAADPLAALRHLGARVREE